MKNKLLTASLFSGSGGLDLGFLNTDKFDIQFANDINKDACTTYTNNIGNHICCDSIKNIISVPTADVILGGPPCQGFSTANPQRSFSDDRNWLFREYKRILCLCNPKVFLNALG